MTSPPHPTAGPPRVDASVTAVVLAGGTSRRFGSPSDDKLDADLGGRSVLEATLSSLPTTWPVAVVGPERPLVDSLDATPGTPRITWTREIPPGGGPVAGISQALDLVDTAWVAVLAGDTPRGGRALPALLDAACGTVPGQRDGALAVAGGHRQPLVAVYRVPALRAAIASLPSPHGTSLRSLLAPLRLVEIAVAADDAQDVDTLDDLAFYRARGAS